MEENPIIENIKFNGIKSNTLNEKITNNLQRIKVIISEILLRNDKNKIINSLKELGYYFKVDAQIVELNNNKIELIIDIASAKKPKLKISFVGIKFQR